MIKHVMHRLGYIKRIKVTKVPEPQEISNMCVALIKAAADKQPANEVIPYALAICAANAAHYICAQAFVSGEGLTSIADRFQTVMHTLIQEYKVSLNQDPSGTYKLTD